MQKVAKELLTMTSWPAVSARLARAGEHVTLVHPDASGCPASQLPLDLLNQLFVVRVQAR